MPLPEGGKQPWPPQHLDPINSRIATWSAWYAGDADQLSAIYGGTQSHDTTGFFQSEQGGWRGAARRALQRMFWGTQLPAGEKRTKLHLPAASDIAATSADLLFGEPPTLTCQNTGAQDRLAELVDDGMHAALLESAEIAAGLGGVYLRTVWDRDEHPAGPWLTGVHPDAAVPEWTWGRLAAVTFWRVIAERDSTVVRHLERHERGAILHAVYEGTATTLGRPVPLTEHTATERLAELVDGNRIDTQLPGRLLVEYVPNIRPNRVWRNLPDAAPLGRADFAGTEPLMDALDETWTSWMRDLRLGKARLILPRVYLQSHGRGQGAGFDLDREVYQAIDALPGDGPVQITENQFKIRVDEHSRTAAELWSAIVRTAGYSAQSFGEVVDGTAGVTATEVRARERRSFVTRDKKTRYWRPALAAAFETLLMVDALVFAGTATPERPDIEFGDSVSDDPKQIAETLSLLDQARAISTEMKVRMQHKDWDDTRVKQEVDRINAEQAAAVDPVDALTSTAATGRPTPEE
jgi:hypothetical protein